VPQYRSLPLTCHGCGAVTEVGVEISAVTAPGALVDACFGLLLFLQTPCVGHVLWAYNARHLRYLRYLKDVLAAGLRERRGVGNASIVSRLPVWLKQAKHRDEALRAVGRLERQLS